MDEERPVLDYSGPERKQSQWVGCFGMLLGLTSVVFTLLTFGFIVAGMIKGLDTKDWGDLKRAFTVLVFTASLWAGAIVLHRLAKRDTERSSAQRES